MTDLKTFLQQKFHFSSFKEGQEETIQSLIEGNDTFTILPTGTGKSLCYQLPSYLLEGQTIIVSPLISLMEDQVSQLRQMGEKSVIAINSTLDFSSKQYVLNHLESFKFIFLSPETLNQPEVLARMRALRIGLFVIDEAHCISEWGHDFRPSYLSLKKNLDILGSPLTLALTATATDSVKEDIKGQLFVNNQVQEFFYSVNRENIFYEVACCEDKVAFLTEFLAERDMPGIIYFSSKKEAERVSGVLNDTLPYPVSYYHGDLSSSDRVKIQQQFIHDEIRVLCATSAFGMGINKENYVDQAEQVIKNLKTNHKGNIMLTTSKIRNILAMVSEIYNEVVHESGEVLSSESQERIQYLRLRIVYESGRETSVKDFVQKAKILEELKKVKDSKSQFLLFCRYMEALVAYRKFSGRDE